MSQVSIESSLRPATEYVIAPPRGLAVVNYRELWRFRNLFMAFTWRDIVVRYKQTILGLAWALIRPLLSVVVFTLVFNRLAQLPTDAAHTPYPVFVLTGLVFWQYYADVILNASMSMVQNAPLLQKVYFPRLIVPIASATTALVDALVASVILVAVMVWYGYAPHLAGLLLLPVLALETVIASLGLGLLMAALNMRYRDVRHALPFALETLKYVTPVVYPASLLNSHPIVKSLMLWLNPIAAIITAARNGLFGSAPIGWSDVAVVGCTSVVVFLAGLTYFRRTERFVADII